MWNVSLPQIFMALQISYSPISSWLTQYILVQISEEEDIKDLAKSVADWHLLEQVCTSGPVTIGGEVWTHMIQKGSKIKAYTSQQGLTWWSSG